MYISTYYRNKLGSNSPYTSYGQAYGTSYGGSYGQTQQTQQTSRPFMQGITLAESPEFGRYLPGSEREERPLGITSSGDDLANVLSKPPRGGIDTSPISRSSLKQAEIARFDTDVKRLMSNILQDLMYGFWKSAQGSLVSASRDPYAMQDMIKREYPDVWPKIQEEAQRKLTEYIQGIPGYEEYVEPEHRKAAEAHYKPRSYAYFSPELGPFYQRVSERWGLPETI